MPEPLATTRRPRRGACLLALALVLLAACGEGPALDLSGEPWPPTVSAPAVLGYIAMQAEPAELAQLYEDGIAWRPAGLLPGRPTLIVMLDAQVLGGDTAFLLPVEDRGAFRTSLVEAPTITSLGDDRYRLDLSANSEIVQMARVAGRMTSARSALDMLEALGGPQDVQLPVVLRFEGDYALLVPTIEAGGVAKQVLASLPGLHVASDASVVLSVDVDRCKTVFQTEIAAVQNNLRGLLLGAKAAGIASAFAALASRGEESPVGSLPLSGEAAWTLLEMLGLDDVETLQVSVEGLDHVVLSRESLENLASRFGDGGAGELQGDLIVRMQHAAGSPVGALLDTLGQAPVADDVVGLAFDAERLPVALSEWLRPLGELAKGAGPPCDKYLAELVKLLGPLAGHVVLTTDEPSLAFSLKPGRSLDFDGLAAWWMTLADAAGWKGLPREEDGGPPEDLFDGWQIVEDGGLLVVVPPGGMTGEAIDRATELLRRPAAPDDPGLAIRVADVAVDLSSQDGELTLRTRLGPGATR